MARKLRGSKPGSNSKARPSFKGAVQATLLPAGPPGTGAGWNIEPDQDLDQLLICCFDSAAAQHATLARIEAWYEAPRLGQDQSACTPSKSRYVPLSEAGRLCANYQGFNFPLDAVRGWLRSMALADPLVQSQSSEEKVDSSISAEAWWRPACNPWENALLDELVQRGVPLPAKSDTPSNQSNEIPLPMSDNDQNEVAYLVSTLSSAEGRGSVLAHERQHALFFFSPLYAAGCRTWFPVETLGSKRTNPIDPQLVKALLERGWPAPGPLHSTAVTKGITTDFGLRGYAPSVWTDEWQAHLSLAFEYVDPKEFGAKAADEVLEVAPVLHRVAQSEWDRLRGGQVVQWSSR